MSQSIIDLFENAAFQQLCAKLELAQGLIQKILDRMRSAQPLTDTERGFIDVALQMANIAALCNTPEMAQLRNSIARAIAAARREGIIA